MEERRKLDRFQLTLPATLRTLPESLRAETGTLRAHTVDICSGGAFFRTLSPLPQGTRVRIDLIIRSPNSVYFKGGKSILEVKGRVLRSRSTGMAVAFDTRYRIRSFPDS